ncbi:MAG: primosomal protein N' [Anaerolineales bacterium]|nr:primosomal protein N' [Anaerolineales bacterium]
MNKSTIPSTFAEIAVNVPHVFQVYHYHVPPELTSRVQPGHLVTIPFGAQVVQGIVTRMIEQPMVPETKAVLDVVDELPVVTPQQIELAEHIAHQTLSPLGITLHAMIPAGLSVRVDSEYALTAESQEHLADDQPVYPDLTTAQQRLVDLLSERGPLRGRQIQRALPQKNWRRTAGALARRGVISKKNVLESPSVSPKTDRFVRLTAEADEIDRQWKTLARDGYPDALTRRQEIIQLLLDSEEQLNVSTLYQETESSLADLRQLAKKGLIEIIEKTVVRDPLEDLTVQKPQSFSLTAAQQQVWQEIRVSFDQDNEHPFLLYGVTGSGKTEIYLRAVQHALDRGEQAIILVPEIALTPQTVRRFVRRFPGIVGVLHSELSPGERFDTWRLARKGDLQVIVGPRSALFTPFPRPGIIVVDECHDDSYYQGEIAPRYHARRAAVTYARITGAVCILGSATPDVTSTYQAAHGQWLALSLPERILAHRDQIEAQISALQLPKDQIRYQPLENKVQMAELPPVEIIDMREELKGGNRSIFSRALQESLTQVLNQEEQAILFLNRRGTSTHVFCRDCGESLSCPRCDRSLTFHQNQSHLKCHHCGYTRRMPSACPACGSARIRQLGTGTEQVESTVKRFFPGVRTLRWDRDTTRKKGAHRKIMEAFSDHQADVLIGTQMLAKGLDLPLVTLVGVVLADVGLHLPDYRTDERTFQILTQVAGRAGRSPLGGKVILQTFQPDHFVIRTAALHDYREFYRQEIAHRQQLGYPPFTNLVRLEIRAVRQETARKKALAYAAEIQNWIDQDDYRATRIIGPVPCFFERIRGEYRWQIILRGPDPAALFRERMPDPDWILEVNPPSLL